MLTVATGFSLHKQLHSSSCPHCWDRSEIQTNPKILNFIIIIITVQNSKMSIAYNMINLI